ncbi:uncharacterized protein LOC117324390 [Pecten maximus]|uniref:uncharacterized protein LOC117324390 n=1 Tax=Pecten maximus TaxID=6579 RepID=UPI00145801E0|nr:uncharacterized protein LOC117324390 [Pecten maximus]
MTRLTQLVTFLFVLFSIDSVWLQQLPPQFPPTMFAFMPENKTNGSLIKSFDVTDADNDVITLDIYDEFTRSSVYLVQSNSRRGFVTGNVYLINPANFDFDRGRREVNLGFTANDGQNTVRYEQ